MSGATEPVLVEGLDQVLLIRLYPEAEALSAAGDMALAQGAETAAAGAVLESSQYEPLLEIDAPEGGGPDPVPTTPPINVDVPHVQQVGSELTCTMGNWKGSGRAAQLRLSVAAGCPRHHRRHGNAAHHGGRRWQDRDLRGGATNALGTTAAPPSQWRRGDCPLMASLSNSRPTLAATSTGRTS